MSEKKNRSSQYNCDGVANTEIKYETTTCNIIKLLDTGQCVNT